MFEVYDWVEYNGNPARIMNKNSKICYLVVLEDVIYHHKIPSESKRATLT